MKISVGRPHLYDMWCHIHSESDFEFTPAVGTVDQRYVTLHMGSSSDTKRALAHTSNKIKTSLFGLFRWNADFELGRDSSFAAVCITCRNASSLHRLGSLLGTDLRIHPSTINLTQQQYAKVCV